jgi:hypothetical protein
VWLRKNLIEYDAQTMIATMPLRLTPAFRCDQSAAAIIFFRR